MSLAEHVAALTRSRFFRFGIVGAGGFVVDESLLALFHYGAGLDRYSARALSIFCAASFTWWGNRNLTFAEHAATGARAVAREWATFMVANGLGALINYATYTLVVTFAPAPLNNPLLAAAIGVAVGLVFNFTLSQRFVFRPR